MMRTAVRPAIAGAAAIVVAGSIGLAVASRDTATRAPASSPSGLPSPSVAATAPPQSAVPQVVRPPAPSGSFGLCSEPARPAHLPWPSSASQTVATSTTTTATFYGSGEGASRASVEIAYQPYAYTGDTAAGGTVTVGDREVHLLPSRAAAWWRERSGVCPVVVATLAWPGTDPATRREELLRVIGSLPPVAAAPTPQALPPSRYGLLIQQSDGTLLVKRDSDGAVVSSARVGARVRAVSADGRWVAYFAGADLRDLWVAPVRDLASAQRLTTMTGELGVGIVWAPDGSSLMFAAASTERTPVPEPAPRSTALRVIARDGSGLRELARIATGQHIRPLAWDPRKELAAAQEGLGQKGPGRYVLVSTRPLVAGPSGSSNVYFIDLPDAASADAMIDGLSASADARFVMATWQYHDRSVIRFWPLEGPDVRTPHELTAGRPGELIRGAQWRPGSLELGVNVDGQLQLWTLDGLRRTVRDIGSSVYFSFRFDGTALYSASGPGEEIEVTDLVGPTPAARRLPGGSIGASIDLGVP